jgi:hypothetical protein
MKQEYLKRIAYSYDEINSHHTIEKMNSIEQIHFNFLSKLVLNKLNIKLNKIKSNTSRDMFLQTDEIERLQKKIDEAIKKAA